jgi:type II secretory pathway predicted ATPase ExeA
MYEQYYGLRERPFDLSPNPRFLFLSKGHREALLHLRYGLTGRPGVTVLVGEAGTGKTTLVRAALQVASGHNATIVHLSNPTLTRQEFYEYIASGFSFGREAATSKSAFLRELERVLAARAAADGGVLALIVDEAQSLPHELLEEIRLLTNTESNSRSVAVALVGQPELAARLNEPQLRQLKQRVALRCELPALDLRDTAAYISARVRVAGGNADMLFTRDAVIAIHEHSRGIPRLTSVICDNALVSGFASDVKPVGRDLVLEVCRDFELDSRPAEPAAVQPQATATPAASASVEPKPLFSGVSRPRRFSFF